MPNKTDWNDTKNKIANIYDNKLLNIYASRISICLYMILPLLGVFLIAPPFSRTYTIIMIVVVVVFTIWNMHTLQKHEKQLLEEQVKEYYKSDPSDS